ncbi:hypothetical protein LT42_18770 [Pseudomonas lutea]|uniref:Uncharacterized protein n=1 Tax=Pseudomonas lutea TaxID=243924 RepID=A0A9X0EDT6_9PSED|nr:hypothetical protein LT42_18770 [Pseudomonas lutea]
MTTSWAIGQYFRIDHAWRTSFEPYGQRFRQRLIREFVAFASQRFQPLCNQVQAQTWKRVTV